MKQQEVQTIATDVRAIRCTNSMMHLRSLPILAQQKKKSEPVLVCCLYSKEKDDEKLWQQQCCCYWVCIRLLISD